MASVESLVQRLSAEVAAATERVHMPQPITPTRKSRCRSLSRTRLCMSGLRRRLQLSIQITKRTRLEITVWYLDEE